MAETAKPTNTQRIDTLTQSDKAQSDKLKAIEDVLVQILNGGKVTTTNTPKTNTTTPGGGTSGGGPDFMTLGIGLGIGWLLFKALK